MIAVLEPSHPLIIAKWKLHFQHSSLQITEGGRSVKHKVLCLILAMGRFKKLTTLGLSVSFSFFFKIK